MHTQTLMCTHMDRLRTVTNEVMHSSLYEPVCCGISSEAELRNSSILHIIIESVDSISRDGLDMPYM